MQMNKTMLTAVFYGAFVCLSGCSAAETALSAPAALGSMIGGGLGVAGGMVWAEKDESVDKQKAAAQLGLLGAGFGMLAGSAERREQIRQERETYIERVPAMRTPGDSEIETLKEDIYSNSKNGQNESRSYEDRYVVDDESIPYEGMPR